VEIISDLSYSLEQWLITAAVLVALSCCFLACFCLFAAKGWRKTQYEWIALNPAKGRSRREAGHQGPSLHLGAQPPRACRHNIGERAELVPESEGKLAMLVSKRRPRPPLVRRTSRLSTDSDAPPSELRAQLRKMVLPIVTPDDDFTAEGASVGGLVKGTSLPSCSPRGSGMSDSSGSMPNTPRMLDFAQSSGNTPLASAEGTRENLPEYMRNAHPDVLRLYSSGVQVALPQQVRREDLPSYMQDLHPDILKRIGAIDVHDLHPPLRRDGSSSIPSEPEAVRFVRKFMLSTSRATPKPGDLSAESPPESSFSDIWVGRLNRWARSLDPGVTDPSLVVENINDRRFDHMSGKTLGDRLQRNRLTFERATVAQRSNGELPVHDDRNRLETKQGKRRASTGAVKQRASGEAPLLRLKGDRRCSSSVVPLPRSILIKEGAEVSQWQIPLDWTTSVSEESRSQLGTFTRSTCISWAGPPGPPGPPAGQYSRVRVSPENAASEPPAGRAAAPASASPRVRPAQTCAVQQLGSTGDAASELLAGRAAAPASASPRVRPAQTCAVQQLGSTGPRGSVSDGYRSRTRINAPQRRAIASARSNWAAPRESDDSRGASDASSEVLSISLHPSAPSPPSLINHLPRPHIPSSSRSLEGPLSPKLIARTSDSASSKAYTPSLMRAAPHAATLSRVSVSQHASSSGGQPSMLLSPTNRQLSLMEIGDCNVTDL